MIVIDSALNEHFKIGDNQYKAIRGDSCSDCIFKCIPHMCYQVECASCNRKDNIDVIFVETT